MSSDDVADGGVLEIALTHAAANEKVLSFTEDPELPMASAEDIALGTNGCGAATDLPQLIGVGSVIGNGVAAPNAL